MTAPADRPEGLGVEEADEVPTYPGGEWTTTRLCSSVLGLVVTA